MADLIDKVTDMSVALYIAAALLGTAITTWIAVNQDGWTTEQTAAWDMIPVISVIALVIAFVVLMKRGKGKKSR